MENNYIPDYTMDAKAMEAIIQDELFRKAKEWWNSYKCANDCFITDALYGEICNCIRCTECNKVPSLSPSHAVHLQLLLLQHVVRSREARRSDGDGDAGRPAVRQRRRHLQHPVLRHPRLCARERPAQAAGDASARASLLLRRRRRLHSGSAGRLALQRLQAPLPHANGQRPQSPLRPSVARPLARRPRRRPRCAARLPRSVSSWLPRRCRRSVPAVSPSSST